MRGSRGGSNKHGHYTCKYSALCSFSAFPLSTPVCFPITNKLVAVLHVLGCRGFRGDIGGRCRLSGCSSAGCLHGCAGPAWPRGCVGAQPLPTPACTAGWEPRGPPEATSCVWDGEQSRRFTSPPTRADFLLGVFTTFPRQLPMGTSQTETPVRLAVPAGSDTSSPFTCWSCRLQRVRGCADTLEPFPEAPLSFGTSGLRSMLLERLRFAYPCKSGANLLSNFGY